MISERFRQLRASLNMNQKDFALNLNMSQAHISKIEHGKDFPSNKLLKQIAKTFEVNYEWLKNGTGEIWDTSDGVDEVITEEFVSDSTLFKTISDIVTTLPYAEKRHIFDMLLVIKFILTAPYDNPTQMNMAISSMRHILNLSYSYLLEPYREAAPCNDKIVTQNEHAWMEECCEIADNIKSVFLHSDDV